MSVELQRAVAPHPRGLSAERSGSGRADMGVIPGLRERVRDAWLTNNRVTVYLVEHLSPSLLAASLPGAPRRTIRMVAAHVHNARCRWIRTLGAELGIAEPARVDRLRAGRRELTTALGQSSRGMLRLLTEGCERHGALPATEAYTWRNLPLDVGHVLTYFVAHEAHHRGQIVMAARALGQRLPEDVINGLWQWNRRSAEAKAGRNNGR